MSVESPIICIGRGGGGTRLLGYIARDLGLFTGTKLNVAGDCLDIVDAVYGAVRAKYGDAADHRSTGEIADSLRAAVRDMLAAGDADPAAPWGFKLPECILLLPELQRAFPDARYLWLVRDPLTTCLRRTHMTARYDNSLGSVTIPAAYRYAGRDPAASHADSPALHMAYTTLHQLGAALDFFHTHPPERYLRLQFEDALRDPPGALRQASRWLGIPPRDASIADEVDATRAANPGIRYPLDVEARVADLLHPLRHRLGYL